MNNKLLTCCLAALCAVLCCCSPEAKWETSEVKIDMTIETVSAGFVECNFSTNKEAYYLIAIEEAWDDFEPETNQKQFMTLALDSAYSKYLSWRHKLLKEGEFNIAPFSSHSLQYGSVHHFFTGLWPGQEYWIYAFVVNPVTMKPEGVLNLTRVSTKEDSDIDVHFEYRVKGEWDYIYPVDSAGKIYEHFPYIAATRDSLTLTQDSIYTDEEAILYFVWWTIARFLDPSTADVKYGVHAIENDGYQTSEVFQEGHTYYTAISGYDGSFKHTTIYKFRWTGPSCNFYFHDTDSANIITLVPDEVEAEKEKASAMINKLRL